VLHRKLRRLLLGARILRARGLSGYTSPHFTLSVLGHHQLHRGLLAARTSPAMPGTPRCSDIASYAGNLLGARTSPATPGTPRCSNIASYAGNSSLLGHRQLRRGLLDARTSPATSGTPRCSDIASYTGHFLGARTSPATPETSSVLEHRQLRRGLLGTRTSPATPGTPRCSDIASYAGNFLGARIFATPHRCAIKLLHTVRIRVLILDSTSKVLIRA
jgi:hypothetical protein